MTNFNEKWHLVKETLKSSMEESVFNSWISPLDIAEINDDSITIATPSKFTSDWVERNFKEQILSTIKDIDGKIENINFTATFHKKEAASKKSKDKTPSLSFSSEKESETKIGKIIGVQENHTFSNMIISPSNEIAISAMKRIISQDNMSMTYLYGPSGAGKTHLLHAFATEYAILNPSKNVRCLSAEKFAFEFKTSVRENNSIQFKQQIRNNDVLIVEDLQYIISQKVSQIELMHTINSITESGGKVIISSNVSPFLIDGINKELIARTSFGLLIDIQSADKELKEDFINKKTKELNFKLSNEITDYLATNFRNSLRELEGAITRIFHYSFLSGNDITISFLNTLLKDMFTDFGTKIEISDIKQAVAKQYCLTPGELSKSTKLKKIAVPRQIAIYLCKTLTSKSLVEIGDSFGGKNHSTIIHSIKKIEKMMDECNKFAKEVNLLKSRF